MPRTSILSSLTSSQKSFALDMRELNYWNYWMALVYQPRQLSTIARQEAVGRSCGGCWWTSQPTSPLSPVLPRTVPHDSFAEAVK
ncbi:hypothetical protein J6590_087748, partial [Homalodisca vitripennis]